MNKSSKTKLRIFEVHMQGQKAPLYPTDSTIKNAVLKAVVDNMNNGGGSDVDFIKTDKQKVYRDVKISVTYKQDNNTNHENI